jgi:hypothetical protein
MSCTRLHQSDVSFTIPYVPVIRQHVVERRDQMLGVNPVFQIHSLQAEIRQKQQPSVEPSIVDGIDNIHLTCEYFQVYLLSCYYFSLL